MVERGGRSTLSATKKEKKAAEAAVSPTWEAYDFRLKG